MIKRKQELSKTEARALAQCVRKVRTFYTLVGMTKRKRQFSKTGARALA